ncbi:MAG: type II toxin-antitoxin system RelE/ParE family toxin [Bifidobacteriaceae bacterium]|jgi:plasmid stabilization system protein ParE|nr:type II toxin-antitoxin system RelE/ParE family toxin [Bifidobacteriaceae bacterium]
MTFGVIVRPAAEPDVCEARDYYTAISLDLAERFEADFQAAAASLAESPNATVRSTGTSGVWPCSRSLTWSVTG